MKVTSNNENMEGPKFKSGDFYKLVVNISDNLLEIQTSNVFFPFFMIFTDKSLLRWSISKECDYIYVKRIVDNLYNAACTAKEICREITENVLAAKMPFAFLFFPKKCPFWCSSVFKMETGDSAVQERKILFLGINGSSSTIIKNLNK